MNNYKINAIQYLNNRIHYMIKDLAEYYGDDLDEYSSLKVRPGYGYDKFYLDWVDGSYDMSLQSLINFMLQDHHHYKKLLSKETYKKVTKFNKKWPERLYDFSQNEDEEQLINDIESMIILGVRNSCEKYGFSTQSFIDAGYDMESALPHISKTSLVDCTVLDSNAFLGDLTKYLAKNNLTSDDEEVLKEVVEESGDYVRIAAELNNNYKNLTKYILKSAIQECKKKSQCTALALEIKQISADEELLDELYILKESL